MKLLLIFLIVCNGLQLPAEDITPHGTNAPVVYQQRPADSIRFVVFPGKDGRYGYDIYRNNQLFIHQPYIPCMQGNRGFRSPGDAKKIALLVVKKIKAGQMLPSVTMKELQALHLATD